MIDSLLGNVEFIFNASKKKRMGELYLYYRLRLYGYGRGGYLDGFEFSKNERYNVLPKLVRYGWVRKFSAGKNKYSYKLSSHRKVACAEQNTQFHVRYGKEETKDIESFRSWVVSLAEEYSALNNYKKQNGISKEYSYRDKEWLTQQVNGSVLHKHKITKLTKDNQHLLKARVSNDFISGLLGVSERTISTWRSAPFKWKSRKSGDCWYRVLDGFNVYFLRDVVGCVYDNGVFMLDGLPIRKDMKIHIPLRMFTHKYSKGYYGGFRCEG
jgi:hypothetical protein